jgi:hypothetical protein
MPDLDDQINQAHADLEQREQDARKLELRLRKIPGLERLLPVRNYGRPVDIDSLKSNLTARSLINSYDEPLASFLGIQTGSGRKARELREAAKLQAEAMKMRTYKLAAENAFRRERYERTVNAGINPNTGRRWGQ